MGQGKNPKEWGEGKIDPVLIYLGFRYGRKDEMGSALRRLLILHKIKTSASVYTTEGNEGDGMEGVKGTRARICRGAEEVSKEASKRPERRRALLFSPTPGVIKGHRSHRDGRSQVAVTTRRAPIGHWYQRPGELHFTHTTLRTVGRV